MLSQSRRASGVSPEYALLGFLSQQPAHGYDLHQQLITNLGQIWHVSLSQTYNILNRLEGQGFISGSVQEQTKLPDRRRFRLTAAGRRRFESWMHSTAGCSVHAIRIEFATRLYFARAMSIDKARGAVEAQIADTQNCVRRLQQMLEDIPPEQVFNRLGVELRIRQLTSAIRWIRDFANAIGA
jgi:DNA-binding PadR family transcriptional regulator